MKKLQDGEDLPIANFGYKNSQIHTLNVIESKKVETKKKNYMDQIMNAKRLLPRYAREEKERLR